MCLCIYLFIYVNLCKIIYFFSWSDVSPELGSLVRGTWICSSSNPFTFQCVSLCVCTWRDQYTSHKKSQQTTTYRVSSHLSSPFFLSLQLFFCLFFSWSDLFTELGPTVVLGHDFFRVPCTFRRVSVSVPAHIWRGHYSHQKPQQTITHRVSSHLSSPFFLSLQLFFCLFFSWSDLFTELGPTVVLGHDFFRVPCTFRRVSVSVPAHIWRGHYSHQKPQQTTYRVSSHLSSPFFLSLKLFFVHFLTDLDGVMSAELTRTFAMTRPQHQNNSKNARIQIYQFHPGGTIFF